MIMALLAATLAAQPPPEADEGRWRAAEPLIRQMIGEAHGVDRSVDYRGAAHLTVWTRARASDESGICAREELRIEMADAAAAPAVAQGERARIRAVEVERQFHVLKTEDDRPRFEIADDALETACADPREGSFDWIRADSAEGARAAVTGLIAVRAALAEPGSPLIRVRCSRPRTCLDRSAAQSWIAPFDSSALSPLRSTRCGGARRYRCQVFIVLDMGNCTAWHLEMETAWEAPYRLRSATFRDRGAVMHCGDAPN
ncbi:MAG TPA: hypothetical protein VGW40_07155 [Allosphingosinicella sp.]|nr:hypothetical protein [Allosphingosinicella sp.]